MVNGRIGSAVSLAPLGMMPGRAISGFHSLEGGNVGLAMLGELIDQGGLVLLELLHLQFE